MAKNKYDFIKELLADKRITQTQRERVLELAARELSNEGTFEERLKKIEDLVFTERTIEGIEVIENNSAQDGIQDQPNYLDPYNLFNFLFEYNQDPILRSTCHDLDSGSIDKIKEYTKSEYYKFVDHLSMIIRRYSEHERNNFAPPKIKALIRGYLTGKDFNGNPLVKGWSSSGIKTNWSSPELLDWTSENIGVPPNINQSIAGEKEVDLFPIHPQIVSPVSSEAIQNFTQLVLHFKNLFHIKSGEQSLNSILKRYNRFKKWQDLIDFETSEYHFPNNLEHFTDVDRLLQAYGKLVELILNQHSVLEKPRVRLRFYELNEAIYISIHHLNSKYNKTLKNTIQRPFGDTYSSLINNQINGLCNLYLKADFGNDDYAELNLWNGKQLRVNKLLTFEGVEHLLEFPKKKNV